MCSMIASNRARRSLLFAVGIYLRDARFRVGVDHGEVELILHGVQIDEQIVDFVEHFLDARVRTVDLVDDDDRRQARFQRLHQHVAGLRQRAFARVHQQHDAVDQFQGALHFAAEIAVAGGIDDVDLDVVIADAGGFGENGDAALALEFVRIHDALGDVVRCRGRCRFGGAWRRPGWSCRGRRAR